MHKVIVAPFLDSYVALHPGSKKAVKLPHWRYRELTDLASDAPVPEWLTDIARRAWNLDLTGIPVTPTLLRRQPSPFGHGRASYELNMGCNFGCKHCYLGPKPFSGLTWPERDRLLHLLRDAGVVWLQLTGGEPTIDPHFLAVYQRASELGMMLEILTNGSRLHYRPILEALIAQRPHRITVSLYGATETSFDELTQRRGAWNSFIRGLDAAQEASLPIDVSIIVTRDNADELDAMKAFTEDRGLTYGVFSNMSPTIGGKDLPLSSQVPELIRKRPPFTGCDAGRTSMHIDPHGKASTCKIARTPSIDLLSDGLDGLARLAGISDDLLQRTRGCSGCKLSGTCSTCTPLAELYRSANASRAVYCQHPDPAPDAPERR